MNPGCVRCPLCRRPVKLHLRTGRMLPHWAKLSRPGAGFRTLAQKCTGGNKRPEDVK